MKEQLKSLNWPYILVLGLIVKAICSEFSAGTFLIALPVVAYEAYKLYLKHKEPDPVKINAEVQADINAMKAKLSALTLNQNIKEQPKRYF